MYHSKTVLQMISTIILLLKQRWEEIISTFHQKHFVRKKMYSEIQ